MSAAADEALLARLAAQVEGWTGIAPGRGGARASLARWVAARTRELGLPSEASYVAALAGEERDRLVRAVTVGWTWFFRDAEQLAALARLLRDGFPPRATLELWVAGCSTGEDAFTLALLAEEVGRSVRVLGTDLNEASLSHARAGRYGSWALRELPEAHRARFRPDGKLFRIDDRLRAGVSFARHNLLDAPPPSARGFDLVLCRNVLIYFEPDRAAQTLERLGTALSPAGWLVLGASEILSSAPPGLQLRELHGRTGLSRATAGAPQRPSPLLPTFPRASAASLPPPPIDPFAALREGDRLLKRALPAAIEAFALAQQQDPLCAEAHLCLGVALHLSGDPLSAAEALRAALALDGTLWPAAVYAGLCLETLGRPDEARAAYARALAPGGSLGRLEGLGLELAAELHAFRDDLLGLAARRSS